MESKRHVLVYIKQIVHYTIIPVYHCLKGI